MRLRDCPKTLFRMVRPISCVTYYKVLLDILQWGHCTRIGIRGTDHGRCTVCWTGNMPTSNFRSLEPAISCVVMKRPAAENIAWSSWNIDHLSALYMCSWEDHQDGLHDTFTTNRSVYLEWQVVKKCLDSYAFKCIIHVYDIWPFFCDLDLDYYDLVIGIVDYCSE